MIVLGPGAIDKPTVFLSHAVTDQPIAQVVHDEIRRIFANGVNVFASSVPGVVKPGKDWLKDEPKRRDSRDRDRHPGFDQPSLGLV